MTWRPSARSERFAARLQRLHAWGATWRPPLSRVQARRSRERGPAALRVRLAARVELVVRRAERAAAAAATAARGPGGRGASDGAGATRGGGVRTVLRPERLERLAARGVRVERAGGAPTPRPTSAAPRLPGAPAVPLAAPVPRVVRRAAAPAPRTADDDGAPRMSASVRAAWPAPASSPPRPLGDAEVDRVADHVMRTIDRRLLALRERRGRV
jgi:hypothetical protein